MATIVFNAISILETVTTQEYEFLGKLRWELRTIKDEFQEMMNFLEDADSLVQDYPELRSFVAQVRDVAYDVEDVVDEFIRSTYHHSTEMSGCCEMGLLKMCTKSVGDKARHELATRIQEIKYRISDISNAHGRYRVSYGSLLPEQGLSSGFFREQYAACKRGDALLLEEADLVGIEVPKKELTDLILNGDRRRNVISVVGMGGLGKTTLVRKIYDDIVIKSQFVHHAWVTVSESFRLEELFKDIIRQLFNEEDRHLPQELEGMDITRLKSVVKDLLQTKKYIVVFDDVWRTTHWDAISFAFPKNQFGSRIVITTRRHDVGEDARSDASGSIYLLSPLDKEKSMLLFCRKAFPEGTSCPQHLKQISENILGVCGGLPLAIEVIGSSLARRSRREEWESFYGRLGVEMERNSSLDGMAKLLCLSYYDLPLHLKQCFLYLSIFPEDTRITSTHLARLWIAEGFVDSEPGVTLEEVAKSYLDELVDRCLVQVASTNDVDKDIGVHGIMRYIILLKATEHNITSIIHLEEGMRFQSRVRRLYVQGSISDDSKQVQNYGDEFLTITADLKNDATRSSMRTSSNNKERHLYSPVGVNLSSVCDVPKLRTCYVTNVPRHVVLDILEHLKLVKVLILRDCDLTEIPEDIRKLIHLRLLDLNGNPLRELPETFCDLINLQHLFLKCVNLLVLLQTFWKLINLRFLEAYKIVWLPKLGPLYKSITLQASVQIWIDSASSNLGSLKTLNQVQGALEICFASDCNDKAGATEAELSRTHIKELAFLFSYKEVSEGVIDALQPPPNLQVLHIKEFWGSKLPSWITSLDCLTELQVYGAANVEDLPPLGILPSLVKLQIDGFSALKIISREFIGIDYCDDDNNMEIVAFPKLVEFEIINCNELRVWEDLRLKEEDSIVAMPNLEILHIEMCPKLQELPHRLLRKASKWSIHDSKLLPNFSFSGEDVADGGVIGIPPLIPSVQFLKINNAFGSKFPTWITSLNYLKELEVICASNVESLPPLGKLPSLEKLVLVKLSALRVIGREIMGIDNNNENNIHVAIADPSCSSSRSPVAVFPKLVELKIESCYELQEWDCPSLHGDDTIPVMPRLRFLTIKWCPKLKFLPHRLLKKASSMEELYISGCCMALSENLKKDIEHLMHIKEVKINGVDCSMHSLKKKG